MKAKHLDTRVAQHGEYLCLACDSHFWFAGGKLECPHCRSLADLVPCYVENDREEDQMYTDSDFGEGD